MTHLRCSYKKCGCKCHLEIDGDFTPNDCVRTYDLNAYWQKCEVSQYPKLTANVFYRPLCPESAKIAVVNCDGSAYWGTYENAYTFLGSWAGKGDGAWHKIPGKFDSSDWQNSLIERPAKALPDWCKEGEFVWCDPTKIIGPAGYKKVKNIEGLGIVFMDGSCIYFSDKIKQARLRSWMPEEAIGKIVYVAKCCHLITSADEFMAKVGSGFIKLDRLRDFNYQPDGSPCGVLEHLENGEWVK